MLTAVLIVAQQLTFTPYHANGMYDLRERVGWNVGVAPGHVASIEPAVTERLACFKGIVEITLHDLRTAHYQLAHGVDRQLLKTCDGIHDASVGVGQGQADRAGPIAGAGRVGVSDWAGFRQAIAFHHVPGPVPLELRAHGGIERRRAGNDGADERQVARPVLHQPVEGVQHGRNRRH